MKLFLTFLRPIVEYATPIWNLTKQGLCEKIKRVQRRFAQYIFGRKRPSYADRLQILNIPSLKVRRNAVGILMTNKILHGNTDIEPSSLGIITSTLPTRSNGTNLRRARTNCIKNHTVLVNNINGTVNLLI